MENLAFLTEFCEHSIVQSNRFCMKQHLFGDFSLDQLMQM